ncbi:zf-HC2 domain-containing protein [Corynebacterium renale]|uniref:Mycothiol system anti-sigma-R factor n=1 Tax=Corynebacterium renale TaxID=1724 RepID=A0A2A9DK51_9CORY|nr:zf-HC2 domain-containing protein [Corynebacterium renale]PFG27078.1 mycothiol system anti-sigma-R factor [Corynebacterium renale]
MTHPEHTRAGSGGCSDIDELLVRLLDRGLGAEECASIRAQIADCPHCQSRLASEEEIRALLRSCCGQSHASATLRTRIVAQIKYRSS